MIQPEKFVTTGSPSPTPRLRLVEAARADASRMALDSRPLETGGILLGWHEDDAIVVSHVLRVTDPQARTYEYIRNDKAAQSALDDFRSSSPDEHIGYVGEWHSHPAQQPPSHIDYATLRGLALDADYQVALAVFSVNFDGSVTPYLATANRRGRRVEIHRLWAEDV